MPRYQGSSSALSGTQYVRGKKVAKPPKKKKVVPVVFPIGPAKPITSIRPQPLVPENVLAAGPAGPWRPGVYAGRSNPDPSARFVRPVAALPKPRTKPKPKAKPGPLRPPSRAAGSGSQGTAATTPPHAKTGAPAARSLGATETPTSRAKAQAAAAQTRSTSSSVLGPSTASAQLTDTQLAQQMVDAMYAPDVADLASQEKSQQAALQQFTQALIAQLSGIPQQVASDYDLAQTQQTALAQMASNQLAAAGTDVQAQTASDLAAIGAPQQQLDALRAQNANTFGGGAATQFFTQGTIPGQSLAANRAAQLGYARAQPGIAGLTGLDALRNITYQAGLARQKLGSEKRKSLFETTQSLADQHLKEQALEQNQAIVNAKLGLQAQNQQFQQGATVQRLQNEKVRLGMSQLQNDRNWQAQLARLGIADSNLQIRAAESQAKLAKSAKSGGWTNSQVARFRTRAGEVARRSFEGEPIKENGVVTGYRHWTYQEAMREGLAAGIPLTMMQHALNTYWNKPGAHQEWEDPGEGRPYVKFQARGRR